MPGKVHVKGKRKAPLPPSSSIKSVSLPTTRQNENNIYNKHTTPFAQTNGAKLKKKQAPLPPPLQAIREFDIVNKINRNIESNNLSVTGNKFSEKSYETKTIFNITEPKQIKNNLRTNQMLADEPILTKFCSGEYVSNSKTESNEQRIKTEIWNCDYCTLENPFWKIVCGACDRIKPYGIATHIIPVNIGVPSTSANANVSKEVKLRAKVPGNDLDTQSKRNSLDVDIQPNATSVTNNTGAIQKQENISNKRTSMILTKDKDYTMNTLEMEKQRLRAVIRAMNNRALADRYPIEKTNKNKQTDIDQVSHKYESITNNNLDREILKKNRDKELTDNKKIENISASMQTVELTKSDGNQNRLTDDAKAKTKKNNEQHIYTKIQNNDYNTTTGIGDTYYDFIGNLATYCDQVPLGGTMRKLEANVLGGNNQKGNEFVTKAVTEDVDDDVGDAVDHFAINLYVNFNNSIEIKVKHNMTLNDLKKYISTKIVPCRSPKIYFNGLQMQREYHTLAEYGVKDHSALYINTENISVDVDNVHKNVQIVQNEKPIIDPKPGPSNTQPIASTSSALINTKIVAANEPKNVLKINKLNDSPKNTKADKFNGEPTDIYALPDKYRIEHIQLNRITIEKINPENSNMKKNKYRGVCNYNPRCNPDAIIQIEAQKIAATKQKELHPLAIATTSLSKSTSSIPSATKPTIEKEIVKNHYHELLKLDNLNDIALNTATFECAICIVEYEPFEGVVLRNCLHTFCKDCIRNTIIYSEEAEVICPYIDAKYTCDCILQDREIKALLTKDEHDEHLAKSLRVAENQIENSFHCRTPNCKGWCIYEDNVNQFKCPICSLINCLTCRVIHDGLNCKQYQDMVKNNLEGSPENAITKNMLEEMIKNGEAMNCPTCRVVLMKKWGCDWLKCSMCKTEICWVTRGSRWGPAGKGDTSGGCKCGVDGIRCHPKCNYCH